MAANFWNSSHRKLLIRQEDVQNTHLKDKARGLTNLQIRQITIYFCKYIQHLCWNTKTVLRQRVAATACVFFQRFYLCNDFCDMDPGIVAPACVYLASKSEESPLQAKFLVQHVRNLAAKFQHPGPDYDMKNMLDMELVMLEALNYHLVLFSPYDCLSKLATDAKQTHLFQEAWGVLNDCHCLPLALQYPPNILAVAALLTAATLREISIESWLQQLDIDLQQVAGVSLKVIEHLNSNLLLPITPATVQSCLAVLRMAPETPDVQEGAVAAVDA